MGRETINKRLTVVPTVVLIIGMFLTASVVFADASENHGESIDSILSEIRGKLNLDSSAPINPDNVSDQSLEKLGEAVMSFRIPNPKQQVWMDISCFRYASHSSSGCLYCSFSTEA